jgi:hypothetical protein
MKKILMLLVMISVLGCPVQVSAQETPASVGTSALIGTAAEQNPALYKDLFITLVYPQVEAAIDKYYSDYMTYLPSEDPWSYEILSIEKAPRGSYAFTVQLQVRPYVGPHLSVGLDRVTLALSLSGTEVLKFEHLESHQLPPHYSGIMKSRLPGA